MTTKDNHPEIATPMERLVSFTKKLIAVPKEEIDKRTREYEVRKRERKRKPRSG